MKRCKSKLLKDAHIAFQTVNMSLTALQSLLQNSGMKLNIESSQQLHLKKKCRLFLSPISKYILSSCDSRNLNLSPFCNLTSTSLAMWQPSVLETYGNQTTSYINATSGPMRRNFPNSTAERELITSLTKVWLIHLI